MYENHIGFGVAGNFAGHLEQANEASDFKTIQVKEENAPKAIFPFYLPNNQTGSFLTLYPLSSTEINAPDTADNLQIEPEIALICDLIYSEKQISKIIPKQFAAYNDCSIRRPHAKKISEKKNWGVNSKGISDQLIDIDHFEANGILDNFSIVSYHERNGELNQYGETSQAKSYSYFHQKLLDWIIEKMNTQKDFGPAEDIAKLLQDSHYPKQCIISIGATRYLPYGETHFLQAGDKSIVIVFDHQRYNDEQILELVKKNELNQQGISALIQTVK